MPPAPHAVPIERGSEHRARLIEVRRVSRRYRVGEREVTALADVDLDIGAGEFVVVVGPSGSGKSTFPDLIGALDTPTCGTVVITRRQGRARDVDRPVGSRRVARIGHGG